MSTCEGKSVNLLLEDFKSALHSGMGIFSSADYQYKFVTVPDHTRHFKDAHAQKGPFV